MDCSEWQLFLRCSWDLFALGEWGPKITKFMEDLHVSKLDEEGARILLHLAGHCVCPPYWKVVEATTPGAFAETHDCTSE